MSQREPETIMMYVPSTFTEDDVNEFKDLLTKATSHGKWENLTILLTKKKYDMVHMNTDVYDKLLELSNNEKD